MTSHRSIAPGAALAAALALAACDAAPVAPRADSVSRGTAAALAGSGEIVGIDLGVLPGDVSSRPVWITEDGAVYGYSYGASEPTGHPFRWTAATGMQAVASIPPKPAFPIPAGAPAGAFAANAKGEVTGPDVEIREPAWRWSRGAGKRVLDPWFALDPEFVDPSNGAAINRWGHVAGGRSSEGSLITFLWTPVDSFGDPGEIYSRVTSGESTNQPPYITINDNDQVTTMVCCLPNALVWRPDMGSRALVNADGVLSEDQPTYPLAQNNRNQVVGLGKPSGPGGMHATLWNTPPIDRTGFPTVNARPLAIATTSTSLSKLGGVYRQYFKGAQSPAAGPWTEILDWGDGTTTRRRRSSLVLTSAAHTYTRTGTYWVRVYIRDNVGRWAVGEQRVTVSP